MAAWPAGKDGIQKIVAPTLRGESAMLTGLNLRQRMAQFTRRYDEGFARLKDARAFFNARPAEENFRFIDNIEHGRSQSAANLDAIARTFRNMVDQRRREVQALGEGARSVCLWYDCPVQLRQSVKAIIAGYILCLAAELAIAIYWIVAQPAGPVPVWAPMLIPLVLALFVAIRHIRRRMTRITVTGDHVRYESGLFSKITRTVELVKVQDVSVHQTLGQRVLHTGDISMETAGAHSPIVMPSIDDPHTAAEHILKLAHAAGSSDWRASNPGAAPAS